MGYFPPSTALARLGIVGLWPYPWPKGDLGSWHFRTEEDLQSMVAEFFAKQDTEWYTSDIHKLILHYNGCLDEYGNYVEK